MNDQDFNIIDIKSDMVHKAKRDFDDLSRKIIGAAIEVHRELGPGFLESIYEEALKAVKELIDVHFAQLRSYLKATGLKIGLLFNFAKPTLEIKRVVN